MGRFSLHAIYLDGQRTLSLDLSFENILEDRDAKGAFINLSKL